MVHRETDELGNGRHSQCDRTLRELQTGEGCAGEMRICLLNTMLGDVEREELCGDD